MYYFKMYDLTM